MTSASLLYSEYNKNTTVIMSNVTCVGDESRLIDCSYTSGGSGSPVGVRCTNQGMHEITMVSVKPNYYLYSSLTQCHGCLAPCRDGDIRLTGSSTLYEGRLEMCSSRSLWGTVCNRQWTEANSRVVCRSLGYSDEEGRVAPHYSYLFCSFYASFISG